MSGEIVKFTVPCRGASLPVAQIVRSAEVRVSDLNNEIGKDLFKICKTVYSSKLQKGHPRPEKVYVFIKKKKFM